MEGVQSHAGSTNISETRCLFVYEKLDICIGVRVDDMLAFGPSELTKNVVAESRKGHANGCRQGLILRILPTFCSGPRTAQRFHSDLDDQGCRMGCLDEAD